MLLRIREVLTRDEVRRANQILAAAPWEDGRLTAGEQSARAKNNEQLREDCDETRAVQQLLDSQIASAVDEATDPDNHLQPPLPTYYAGAARELERFREFLVAERERLCVAGGPGSHRYAAFPSS